MSPSLGIRRFAAGIVAVALLAAACSPAPVATPGGASGGPGPTGAAPTDQASPSSGGTVVVATTSDAASLDIQTLSASGPAIALLPLFNGLVEKNWAVSGGDSPPIIPALATEWITSDDGLTITFELREGVTFQDGTPWNAAAAEFNFRRMLDPDFEFYDETVAGAATGLLPELVAGKAIDENTFELELNAPNTALVDVLAARPNYYMISPASIEKGGKEAVGTNASGTGPFTIVERTQDVRTVMAPNSNYWGEKPKVDQLIYVPTPDPSARVAALRSGEVHIAMDLPPDQVAALQQDEGLRIALEGLPATKFIECWNVGDGPFSKKEVREAVNIAIDRQSLADNILAGTASPANQIYGPGAASRDESLPQIEFNATRAKELLTQAGYPNGFSLTAYSAPENEPIAGAAQAYEFVQANLAAVGIAMEVRQVDTAAFVEVYLREKKADECVTGDRGYDTDYILDLAYASKFCAPNGINNSCYTNEEFDALLESARTAPDIDEWRSLHRQAQQIFMEDFGSVVLVNGLRPIGLSSSVAGWTPAKAFLQLPTYVSVSE